jgi:hypothetical protein
MSIDTRGRAAASNLRAAAQPVDASELLRDIHRTHRRRSRRNVVLAAAVAVAVVAVSAVVVTGRLDPGPAPAIDHRNEQGLRTCAAQPTRHLSCLSDTRWQLSSSLAPPSVVTSFVIPSWLKLPAVGPSWRVPADLFFASNALAHAPMVQVMFDVAPVKPKPGHIVPAYTPVVIDHTAGHTMRSVALWLSHRPWIRESRIQPTSVGGLPAYCVYLKAAPGNYDRNHYAPLLSRQLTPPRSRYGVNQNWWGMDSFLAAEVFLLRLPDGHLGAVLSYGVNAKQAARGDQLVQSLRFGT